jgi:hypothetical protein
MIFYFVNTFAVPNGMAKKVFSGMHGVFIKKNIDGANLKQELNSLETSCDRVKGLIGGMVKKASFSMVERDLVKKVSFGSLEMSVVKKSISAWLDWAKKRRTKSPKNGQKIVKKFKKLSYISSNLVKINKKR